METTISGLGVQGLGEYGGYIRDISPIMENQMENKMENEMSTGQNSYPASLNGRNLLTVAYETQGLAYGVRVS